MTPPAVAFESATFRQALGAFATGVTAVCGIDGDEPVGLVANSFTSVSLDPPLVSFCIARGSSTWARLQGCPTFAVTVLAGHQARIGSQLAAREGDRFAGVPWAGAPSGAPVIGGGLAWFDCSPWARYDGGDHEIVVGRVEALGLGAPDAAPLLFHRSRFLDA